MKRHSYIKRICKGKAGFTLLEVVCVIAILGMMAAMVLPASVGMLRNAKISATQERLQDVKRAITGGAGAYDSYGNSASAGFSGHTGRLPYLFWASWNDAQSKWDWIYTDGEGALLTVNDGTGQPVELWREIEAAYGSPEWAGPYLSTPRDPYPDDTKNISYASDPDIFTKKQVEGRLSDAWGNALCFWLEYPLTSDPETGKEVRDTADITGAVFWIISGGPDGKAAFNGEEYVKDAKENQDNITVKIMPREWGTCHNSDRVQLLL